MANQHTRSNCDHSEQSIPLVKFNDRGREYTIYSLQLPILSHEPSERPKKLPEIYRLSIAEGHA